MSDLGQIVFGPVATDRRERAVRLVEEAVEVAQAEGVPLEILERVARRCYSRPVGNVADDLGAVVLTLEALAANLGVDLDSAGEREFARVTALDPIFLAGRHESKIAEGCAVGPVGRFRCTCPDRAPASRWVTYHTFPAGDPRRALPIIKTERHLRGCPWAADLEEVDHAGVA